MYQTKWRPLTTRQLRPEGWLRRQLEIQAKGLSGHLDLIWPDIRESRWIGGDREGWERVPYWLDGFIPLAWLLEDEALQERAKRYIDAILAAQKPDGWICPCEEEERAGYDVWAAFLICKVLVLYYDCTLDERIEEAVYKAMKQLLRHISDHTLFNWAATRWYECLIPLFWLYERRPEAWMMDLAHLLEIEGVDFEKAYEAFDFAHPPVKKYWTQINHVVNAAMALKCRALMSYITGEDPNEFAKKMYGKIMKYNSMVTGHFTGDECFSGDSPIQGSECCSVAEAMYSFEVLLAMGGEVLWGDLLEKEAFNMMPATTTEDMWTHQYVQMTNQICAKRIPEESVPFNSNSGESHMFGLEPNFGCCTANFNQAWPKFALATIMEGEEGIAVNTLAPSSARVERDGAKIRICIRSEYPFRDDAVIEVETDRPVTFTLAVRIPGFAQSARVEGHDTACGIWHELNREWTGISRISVELGFDIKLVDRPYDAKALIRGPLVFAVPVKAAVRKLEYSKDGVERKAPWCDLEMTPVSPWNYGFCTGETEKYEVVHSGIGEYPFAVSDPPVKIKAKMVRIPWKEKDGVCEIEPDERKALGEPETVFLQPYGCTNLRMTEMPLVKIPV